jgi:hypothetical protein
LDTSADIMEKRFHPITFIFSELTSKGRMLTFNFHDVLVL